jgi:hypothetical protein
MPSKHFLDCNVSVIKSPAGSERENEGRPSEPCSLRGSPEAAAVWPALRMSPGAYVRAVVKLRKGMQTPNAHDDRFFPDDPTSSTLTWLL